MTNEWGFGIKMKMFPITINRAFYHVVLLWKSVEMPKTVPIHPKPWYIFNLYQLSRSQWKVAIFSKNRILWISARSRSQGNVAFSF